MAFAASCESNEKKLEILAEFAGKWSNLFHIQPSVIVELRRMPNSQSLADGIQQLCYAAASVFRSLFPIIQHTPMSEDTIQRAHDLVEDLRAEVDFEIDDVIANIIRNLPEEYFRSLALDDQLTHLKALLAISICNLKTELTLRSEDGRHIAVVARQNYPGLLAKIISHLPTDQMLIGAKIFTSKTHDFIIDLFEFKSSSANDSIRPVTPLELEDLVLSVSKVTGKPQEQVAQFVSFYRPASRVLKSATIVREHFLAYEEARHSDDIAVRWIAEQEDGTTKLIVSAGHLKPRELFLKITEFLTTENVDVEQAYLDDFRRGLRDHFAISSFLVSGEFTANREDVSNRLSAYLRKN